jgi:hypothetical protein
VIGCERLKAITRRSFVAGLAVALLWMAACGSDVPSFRSVQQIVEALRQQGVVCSHPESGKRGAVVHVNKRNEVSAVGSLKPLFERAGTCSIGGHTAGIYTFESSSERNKWVQLVQSPTVIGPNWAINVSSKRAAETVQGVLGGSLP